MSKKKKPEKTEETKQEPIYLVDTLSAMDEIKSYGLNRHIIGAILKNKFYTLSEAHEAIRKALEGR